MGANDSKDISVFDHKTEPEEQEPELPLPPDRRGGSKDIPVDAYRNPKLDLFQSFVCNSEAERECLSNAMDLWDCIPRYSISRQEMNKRRDEKGNLPPLHLNFKYHGQEYTVIIFPTAILEGEKYVFYYPSAREELVEDALRKIALQQGKGFFEQNITRSFVWPDFLWFSFGSALIQLWVSFGSVFSGLVCLWFCVGSAAPKVLWERAHAHFSM